MKPRNLLFIALLSLALSLSGLSGAGAEAPRAGGPEFQKGMCYVTWNRDKFGSAGSDASLEQVAKLGVTWVAIVPTWYQDNCTSSTIYAAQKTPTDESVIHAIQKAHSLGMKVMLKPHLDLVDTSDGSWRGDIACATDSTWEEWFKSYREFAVHYAKMAEENGAEIFCFGTELTSVSPIKENLWRELIIKPIRETYKGPITYAANWNEEYQHIKFWDVLDYIGIDAYFPLSDKDIPNFQEIKAGWDKWVKDIEEVQARFGKPVIFPEVGYCSANGAARTPWEELVNNPVNLGLQADCYQALLETFWEKPWFYGAYWWKWGTDLRFGGPHNKNFTPQNKPAQDIVAEWYKKPASRP